MASKKNISNKKHIAHLEQVRRQVAMIRYISISIISLVVILVGYGILSQTVFLQMRTVATVNGDKISVGEFQKRAGFTRAQLVSQYGQYYQFAQFFGDSNPQITNVLQQIQGQLDPLYKEVLGQQVLDNIIDQILIAQEAEKMGISVSDDEVEARLREVFGFFPDGTPTAAPTSTPYATSTLNPEQLALVTITPTPSPFPTFTPAPTSTPDVNATATPEATATSDIPATPEPTATPYTQEGFETQVADVIDSYKNNGVEIDEAFYRELLRSEILREKMVNEITKDLQPVEEQVWARHILVGTEVEAQAILVRLENGADFGELAKNLSIDTGSGALGGDLNWNGRGAWVQEFENAAFSLAVGEISEPIESQFGWHIIQVLGKEDRPVDNDRFTQLKETAFTDWVKTIRDGATIDINDLWKEVVPVEPNLQPQQ